MSGEVLAYAIPVVLVFVLIEAIISHVQKRRYFTFKNTLTNIHLAIWAQFTDIFVKVLYIVPYTYILQNHGLFDIPTSSLAVWVFFFFLYEFVYYLFHWAAHTYKFMWATHSVHHQSEEFNLSAGIRQSGFNNLWVILFYWPLALIGFPLEMLMLTSLGSTLYQLLLHTRYFGKFGVLEWFLNTPSHHRVHHGKNPKYIDRNMGGVLIIYDRIFGTFAEEEEEPEYGVTKPILSTNPITLNVVPFLQIFERPWEQLRDKFAERSRSGFRLNRKSGLKRSIEEPKGLGRKMTTTAVLVLLLAATLIFQQFNLQTDTKTLLITAIVTVLVLVNSKLLESA